MTPVQGAEHFMPVLPPPVDGVVEVVLDGRFEGPPGHAHGGAIAAIFDQVLGDAVHGVMRPAYTANLEVDFRRRWPLGVPGRFTTRLDPPDGRKLRVRAWLHGPDGALLADARGLWVAPRSTG